MSVKRIVAVGVLLLISFLALVETEKVGAVEWSYSVSGGDASVNGANLYSGSIMIPSTFGGCSVTSIGSRALSARILIGRH